MAIPKTSLEQWAVLQAIVEHGSFAAAAEALHRSQSAVSYTVAKLQEQLGVPLLQIDGRRAQLTEIGRVLLKRAANLLADAQQLEQLACSMASGWEPEIRLVVDQAFPTAILLQALQRFAPICRDTRVQLKEVVLSGADEALIGGEADLVIGGEVPVGYLGDPLLQVEFVAVAHPQHALHRLGRDLTTDDLARELQVVIRDSGTRAPVDRGWLGAAQRWTVSSAASSLAVVSAGLGFAWLPCHLIQPQIDAGLLKPLPLNSGQRRSGTLYLMFGQPQLAGPATRQLASVLREVAAGPHS
ncbi:MAG: LysR family transcriptional regulator [Chitinivorax sp.]